MKKLFIILSSLVFLLSRCTPKAIIITLLFLPAYAQYMPDHDYYQLEIRKLNDGYVITNVDTLDKSGTYKIQFLRGDETTGGYESPYLGVIVITEQITNTPALWQGTIAVFQKEYEFSVGTYEMTIFEHSPTWGLSPRSEPCFFVVLSDKPVKIILQWGQ